MIRFCECCAQPRFVMVPKVTSTALASQEAIRLARDYVKERKSKLLPSVVARTVALSLSHGDTVDDLMLRLKAADLVVSEIETCLAPGSSDEAAWTRHDPDQVLREGLSSKSYVQIDRSGLANAASVYLEQEWLASPIIDWMIVDALITTTMIEYGEETKKNTLAVPDRALGVYFNSLYRDTDGNLVEMLRDAPAKRQQLLLFSLFGVAPPLVFAPFSFTQFPALAVVGGIIYPAIAAPFLVVRYLQNRRQRLKALADFEESLHEWRVMHEIWKTLEGPVLDPQEIAGALIRAAETGVEFDRVVYKVVERAVESRRAWSITSSIVKLRF